MLLGVKLASRYLWHITVTHVHDNTMGLLIEDLGIIDLPVSVVVLPHRSRRGADLLSLHLLLE
jgi:hypothetical protein